MKRGVLTTMISSTVILSLALGAAVYVGGRGEVYAEGNEAAAAQKTAGTNYSPTFSGNIALYVGAPDAIVNGKLTKIDDNPAIVPFIDNSRTLIPLRFVANALGFSVEWREADGVAILAQTGLKLEFKLASNTMNKNGEAISMETAAISKNGRIFVPIAYVAKAMGLYVTYDRGLILLDSEKTYDTVKDKDFINSMISRLSGLPFVGSASEFNKIMKDLAAADKEYPMLVSGRGDALALPEAIVPGMDGAAMERSTDNAVSAPMPQNATKQTDDYSTTNIQVQGVDEADIIKTDGSYIYHLSGGKLNIIKADGQGSMAKTASLDFEAHRNDFYPFDMYVDGNRLCVIGSVYLSAPVYRYDSQTDRNNGVIARDEVSMPYPGKSYVKVQIFDISVKSSPVMKREFTVEGSLLTSRKVDNMLYLVVNNYMYFYGVLEPYDAIPRYSDNAGDNLVPLDCGTMRYFPGSEDRSMLIICGIDTTNDSAKANISSLIGSGSTVYMSRSALYIAKYNYGYSLARPLTNDSGAAESSADKTSFYKFSLNNGNAVYNSTGTTDGSVLNQYSMDEYNGYFRVATTIGWSDKNALTVFNSSMNVTGKIGDMAPGEKIYSARFMGDRAFMVTFRTVDPLFAIDLSSPSNPKVLGELKIPGYSTYLHPYDENRLIGFGRDTEELITTDSRGNIVSTGTVNRGLKLALFDISNMSNPKELSVVTIGNKNANSELLHNPKALLFSKEKGFIAFPVTQYADTDYDGTEYKAFTGAHVYNINPNGITLRGKISQASGNTNSAGDMYNDYIQRIIYIGNTFYCASNNGIQSNNMDNLKYIGSVKY